MRDAQCTSLLKGPISEMTYAVSSGTLNSTIPYHTVHTRASVSEQYTLVSGTVAVMLCSWEGNCGSGVAVATHHRQ